MRLTRVLNSKLWLLHFSLQCKILVIIIFSKPDEPLRHSILLSSNSFQMYKILCQIKYKLITKRISISSLMTKKLTSRTRFGFCYKYSTNYWVHLPTDAIVYSSAKILLFRSSTRRCSSIQVWHTGLVYKFKKILPILNFFFQIVSKKPQICN